MIIGSERRAAPSQSNKSFLVLFFKKELLSALNKKGQTLLPGPFSVAIAALNYGLVNFPVAQAFVLLVKISWIEYTFLAAVRVV